MKSPSLLDWLARIAVSAGALLPYLPALSLNRVFVTDDVFTSDIFNGELPARVLIGQLIASGQAPVWSSDLCSGFPMAAGGIFEPLSTGLFSTLPTAPAVSLLVLTFVLIAAHGAYGLARRLGAERSGAVLAGIAFAGSGYLVTQLKHLAIVTTVAWLPWGLLLLDRALAPESPPPGAPEGPHPRPATMAARLRDLGLFGLVFAEQVLCGFPQSVYICGLVYGVWSAVLLLQVRGRLGKLPIAAVLGLALCLMMTLGALCGAPGLLPLAELAKFSDRRGALSWEFASMAPYAWTDLLNFIVPYANGDIADATYRGEGIFWENYGYVGAATFALAAWAVVRGLRRPRVALLLVIAIGCMLLVLGRHTPVYYLAWKYLPGMGKFRFPTRFLVVVDLAIAVLGGIGLSIFKRDCSRLLARYAPRAPSLLAAALVIGTAIDLFANQSHQNPFVPASEWLSPPAAVTALGRQRSAARFYAPLHNDFHMQAFSVARGWSNLEPYYLLRATVAPNTGVYWDVATADCYAGIAPSWFVDVWGDHSRHGFVVPPMMQYRENSLQTSPAYAAVLAAYGVTHVLSPVPVAHPRLIGGVNSDGIYEYEVPGRRARIVGEAELVNSNREAARKLLQPDFDPDRVLFIHRRKREFTLDGVEEPLDPRTEARIVVDESRHVRVLVNAPQGGYLLLADTYYPGWHARVDGAEATVLRANISSRAVWLPRNAKVVEFTYDATPFFRGLWFACIGSLGLVIWTIYFSRASRSRVPARVDPIRS